MLVKEDNFIKNIKAIDVFMSLPDELIIDMCKYDKEGLLIMCLAIGIELFNKEFPEKCLAN